MPRLNYEAIINWLSSRTFMWEQSGGSDIMSRITKQLFIANLVQPGTEHQRVRDCLPAFMSLAEDLRDSEAA